MNRHDEDHKAWSATGDVMKAFTDLPGTGWYVFVAELLHNKGPSVKNVHYVHDILVNDGEYLVGVTQEERQGQLQDLFLTGDEIETPTHLIVNPNLWLPVEYENGFSKLFASLTAEEDEGLVFKDPNAKLAFCTRQKSNTAGLLKCRVRHKNFSF